MDFECWESRNLARCTLSEAYRRVLYHLAERKTKSSSEEEEDGGRGNSAKTGRILNRERVSRMPRLEYEGESSMPYYRRFSRGMGLLSSSEEHLSQAKPQKEYIQIRGHVRNPNVPHYRRFARSSSLSTPSPGSSSSSDESTIRPPAARLPPLLFRYPEPPDTGSIVVWPASGRMNAFLGKAKIDEFIKKTWKFSSRIKYRIEFKCIIRLKGIDRYKYSTLWSNRYFSSRIFFTIDASSEDDYVPVSMTYSLPDGKRLHRPNSSESHVLHFLKHLDPMMGKSSVYIKKMWEK